MPRRPDPRAARSVALDVLLLVAATAGVLTLIWRVAAAALGLELVSFATGSMTPVYPQGSVAIAQQVPLDAVHPGDVVTVQRGAHLLPITHRVVSIRPEGDQAVLRLKGDANRDPDPTAYHVTSLDRIVVGVPQMLSAVVALQGTAAGVIATLLAAGGAVWAFWPRRREAQAAVP